MRQELAILPDEIVVLFVGSEFKRKGLDYLIPAVKQEGLHLVAVGRGDNITHYKKLAEQCGLTSRVHFVGLSEDVQKYYSAADIVVLPSKSEAFGMSILEGMACGLPVVVSANVGAAALITDGQNGFVVEQKRLAAFFSNLPDGDILKRVGEAARQTALDYQWQNVANQYEKLFYEIANKKSPLQ